MLSFLDLKLDLVIRPDRRASWLDQDEYEEEIAAGAIAPGWQESVADTVASLDRQEAAGEFPPAAIQRFRPPAPTPP